MKFCKDCKHMGYAGHGISTNNACAKEVRDNLQTNLVTGEQFYPLRGDWTCSSVRDDNDKCGVEAKWFEPRELGWFEKLIARFKQ